MVGGYLCLDAPINYQRGFVQNGVPHKLVVSLLIIVIIGWLVGTTMYGQTFEVQGISLLAFGFLRYEPSFIGLLHVGRPVSIRGSHLPGACAWVSLLLGAYGVVHNCWHPQPSSLIGPNRQTNQIGVHHFGTNPYLVICRSSASQAFQRQERIETLGNRCRQPLQVLHVGHEVGNSETLPGDWQTDG